MPDVGRFCAAVQLLLTGDGRDALLQLASKLEEQARLQSSREADVIDMLNNV